MRQIYEYHPVIGFRFIPGLKARIPHEGGGYLVCANATGFRYDHEFESAKPADMRRVLVFGDSFTAGEGVSNGKRWTDALERLVPDLQVYNFGLPATGTDQHYLIYKEYAGEIDHDLLIIAVFVENIRRVGSKYRWFANDQGRAVLYAKPYFELHNGRLILRGMPPSPAPIDPASLGQQHRGSIAATARFPKLKAAFKKLRNNQTFERMVVASGLMDRIMKLTGYQRIPEYNGGGQPAWAVMREIIREWIAVHDRPVVLLPIPLYHYVAGLASPASYQACLREATESAGGTFVDPLPELLKHPPAQRRSFYYPRDGHLTVEGNEALARAVAPAIQACLQQQLAGEAS
jgi:carbamoyltransferase